MVTGGQIQPQLSLAADKVSQESWQSSSYSNKVPLPAVEPQGLPHLSEDVLWVGGSEGEASAPWEAPSTTRKAPRALCTPSLESLLPKLVVHLPLVLV